MPLSARSGPARPVLLVLLCVALAACGGGGEPDGSGGPEDTPSVAPAEDLVVTSSAFEPGGTIPGRFTCDGENVSPPLLWSGAPDTTAEYAIVVSDPDAPAGTFIHWVVIHVPAILTSIEEGIVPAEAVEIEGSFGETAYSGPCPPEGDEPHRYRYTVYALDRVLQAADGASYDDAAAQIEDATIARGTLEGLYGR